jgi:hypothetical protein
MAITLIIIGILLFIFLWRFWTALLLQLRTAKTIKNNLAPATQSYCIVGLTEELEEISNKLCKLIDKLLDFDQTVKITFSFKKINLQFFLTNEEIEFLEENFF